MQEQKKSFWNTLSPLSWCGLTVYLLIILLIYFVQPVLSSGHGSAFRVIVAIWNCSEYDYSHGWLVVPISIFLLARACRTIDRTKIRGSLFGLVGIILGCLLFLASYYSYQWRITNFALPILLWGAIMYFWGIHCANRCAFPLIFLWFSIPVPGFQHTTVGMQILATEAAQWVISLLGIQAVQEGTNLTLASGDGVPISISGGCSGMRSLVALIMLSTAWAYIADKLAYWKRLLLAASAIPLAILANAARVASIFILAEYIDLTFASKTWHDWSGLLIFFPSSLLGLTLLHSLLAGEIPFLKRRRTYIRTNNTPIRKEGQV